MKALVLAGGFPQIALIRELKRRGIIVILADYNDEPVAKCYADKFYQVSTLDLQAVHDVALKECIDFLITVCTDQALLTVARVSEDLKLPCYLDYKTALNATNKQYMKSIFMQNNIPTAKYVVVNNAHDPRIDSLSYPLVVKPVDCNSSKGVRSCNCKNDVLHYLPEAISLSRTKTAIVEEFITGIEISVDAYVENGNARVLSISKIEKIPEKDKYVIFRGICPAKEAFKHEDLIKEVAQRIAVAFCLIDSPLLIQMIINESSVSVVEFSARTGGGTKYLTIKQASGFDAIKAVVDLSIGIKPHIEEIYSNAKIIVTEHIYCKPGVFDHLAGFQELKEKGIIEDYYLYKKKGAECHLVSASGDRIAGYMILANSEDELKEKHSAVSQNVQVIDEKGMDIMRHDLIPEIEM